MASKGAAYERFVYEKVKKLFPDAEVALNDRIFGKQSKLMREIDISITIDLGEAVLLYIVQCKDRGKRPADIVILGEFSSVIQDVGAAKGFLLCTSGFAKTNHNYAESLGIELLTVEDISSDRWTVDIKIPLILVRKELDYALDVEFVVNEEFAALTPKPDMKNVIFDINGMITLDNGVTAMTVQHYFENIWLKRHEVSVEEGADLAILDPGLRVSISGVWLECLELTINVVTKRRYFLKYLTPNEYWQIRDHRRGITVPGRVSLLVSPEFDAGFSEVPDDKLPVNPVLSFEVEEWTPFEQAQGKGVPRK